MNQIDNIEFHELEAEKYWSFPKSYKGDPKTDVKNMIFSGEYIGAVKRDGSYYRFIKDMDGNMVLQGRSRGVSGSFNNKIDWVPQLHPFFDSLPNGTCLLGEIFFPNNEGSSKINTIMLCKSEKAVARQVDNPVHYYVFDMWAYDGISLLNTPMSTRVKKLQKIETTEYIELAKYHQGVALWSCLETTLEKGGEGIVMTKANTVPAPGKRTARKTLKVKKEISETIDCIFTGVFSEPTKGYTGDNIIDWEYWENQITGEKVKGRYYRESMSNGVLMAVTKPYFNNWAGSLEIGLVKGDKVVGIGYLSGLTDEIKSEPLAQKGKVIEITCMEILETNKLRHAKMLRFRPDLTIKDATWEKVFGA